MAEDQGGARPDTPELRRRESLGLRNNVFFFMPETRDFRFENHVLILRLKSHRWCVTSRRAHRSWSPLYPLNILGTPDVATVSVSSRIRISSVTILAVCNYQLIVTNGSSTTYLHQACLCFIKGSDTSQTLPLRKRQESPRLHHSFF